MIYYDEESLRNKTNGFGSQRTYGEEFFRSEFGMDEESYNLIFKTLAEETDMAEILITDIFEDESIEINSCELFRDKNDGLPEYIRIRGRDGNGQEIYGSFRIARNSSSMGEVIKVLKDDIDLIAKDCQSLPRILELVASDKDKINDGKNYHKLKISMADSQKHVSVLCEIVYLSRDRITHSLF